MTEQTNDAPTPTAPAKEKRTPITESTYFKADGSEADSPLDSATKLTFKLTESGKSFDHDMTDICEAALAAGVDPAKVNAAAAYAGFGAKTKWNNIANSIRNGKQKGTDEAGPEAQAKAVADFIEDCLAGNWRGEPGEGFVESTVLLAEAVVRWQAKNGKQGNVDSTKAKLDALSKEQRAAYRKDPRIAAELAQIRAEKAAAKAAAATGTLDLGAL